MIQLLGSRAISDIGVGNSTRETAAGASSRATFRMSIATQEQPPDLDGMT